MFHVGYEFSYKKPLFFAVFCLGGHHVSNKHRVADAHAKRDFRIFCIVIHRSLHTMQNAAQQSRPPRRILQSFSYFQTLGFWGCCPIPEQNTR